MLTLIIYAVFMVPTNMSAGEVTMYTCWCLQRMHEFYNIEHAGRINPVFLITVRKIEQC